ncbi:MAG: CRTAC1 family protein [Halobacteriaceae archaeon]
MNRTTIIAVALAGLAVLAGCTAVGGQRGGGAGVPDGQWFEEVALHAGISYNTSGPHTGNGDGAVVVADYDGDGWTDLLALGGDEPVLYHNTGGEFEASGALPPISVTELKSGLFFDYDTDGDQDLLLVPRDDEMVFLENRDGKFVKRDVGLSVHLDWGTGATAGDFDRDGCPDVFVTQNGNWIQTTPNRSRHLPYKDGMDNGNPNLLFDGDCQSFENVTAEAGIEQARWSLATSFVDLNGDDWPDIHVANDYNADVVYVNQRDGTFERRVLGSRTNSHGMASDVEDINHDGLPDIFVTNAKWNTSDKKIYLNQTGLAIRTMGNTMLVNQGNATFVDKSAELGIRVGGWGWSGNLVDLDNDGNLDLIHSTRNYLAADKDANVTVYKGVRTYPRLWERTDDGDFRRLNATEMGLVSSSGRGLATLDYDRDGDQDVVVADTVGRFKLYENHAGDDNHWLQVRVHGTDGQTAVGAEIHVTTAAGETVKYQTSETNFFSQNTRVTQFGLGNRTEVTEVRVVWPDGHEVVLDDVGADRRVDVYYDGETEVVYADDDGGLL